MLNVAQGWATTFNFHERNKSYNVARGCATTFFVVYWWATTCQYLSNFLLSHLVLRQYSSHSCHVLITQKLGLSHDVVWQHWIYIRRTQYNFLRHGVRQNYSLHIGERQHGRTRPNQKYCPNVARKKSQLLHKILQQDHTRISNCRTLCCNDIPLAFATC